MLKLLELATSSASVLMARKIMIDNDDDAVTPAV
jgi:hypothetical protein